MLKIDLDWKKYGMAHGILALCGLFLPLLRWLLSKIPFPIMTCIIHDLFHLYCPLCGGTRTVAALLKLDIALAWQENPFVVVATVLFVALDIILLIRLIPKGRVTLVIPQWVQTTTIVLLVLWGIARNLLMIIWGIDPVGDLGGYWEWLHK